jgi:hypothetical protein
MIERIIQTSIVDDIIKKFKKRKRSSRGYKSIDKQPSKYKMYWEEQVTEEMKSMS